MDKWTFGSLLVILLMFAYGCAVAILYTYPIGADIHFHIYVANYYAHGENGMFSPYVMAINRFPYPPIFHLLFVPSIWLGIQLEFAKVLQIILYTATITTSIYLMRNQRGKEAALLTGLLLLSCIGYWDRTLQAIPQTFDMLLFPLILQAYLTKKTWHYLLLSGLIIYAHGPAAIALIGGTALLGIMQKRWKQTAILIAIILPIILVSLPYYQGAMTSWSGGDDTPQETNFLGNPLLFTYAFVGLLGMGFVPFIQKLQPSKWHLSTDLEKLSILTIISLLPMLILWPDRLLAGYIQLPLAYLLVSVVSVWKSKEGKPMNKLFLFLFAMVFINTYIFYCWNLAAGLIHNIPPESAYTGWELGKY